MSTAAADGEPATVTAAGNGSASGPRVSFNRDVHVKRIGPRTEPTRVQTPNGAVRKEHPENLSQEALRKEAEFVLAQADRIDRRARSNSAGSPQSSGPATDLGSDRFNSLPSRTKSHPKRVSRSSSDAASKKPPATGKGGLLNLFGGRKSAAPAQDDSLSAPPRPPRLATTNLGRSKSDVGSSAGAVRPQTQGRARVRVPRRATQELGELRSIGGKKHDPLTPIIEAATPLENGPQVDPLTVFVQRARAVSEEPQGAGRRTLANNSFTHHGMEAGSRSVGNLHSSQLPPEKPHLTKGVTVESIVRRLSSERHSSPPPAQIVSGGFSYTRHSEPTTTTTIGSRTYTTSERESAKMARPSTGFLDATQRPSPPLPKYRLDEADHSPRSLFRTVRHTNSDEDEGLGGIDYSRHGHAAPTPRYKSSAYLSTSGPAISPPQERTSPKTFSDEDHLITPHIRSTPVFGERGSYTTSSYTMHYRGQADGKEHLPEFHELAQRREILESRIRSRIGSRDLLDRLSPERPVPIQLTPGSAGSGGVHYRTTVDRLLERESPRRTLSPTFREVDTQNGLRVTRSSSSKNSPTAGGYVETHVTKTVVNRDGKPVSEEYVERRKYPGEAVEAVSTSRTIYDRDGSAGRTELKRYNRVVPEQQQTGVRHVTDKGDSGIENDFRKDSFNQEFMVGNRFTLTENVGACEDFLRMERTHTNSCMRKPRRTYAYRERSIDDGSRYDPRLDDISTSRSYTRDSAKLKTEKKTGSLAKVKQFVSSTRKKLTRLGTDDKREPGSGSRSGSLRSDSDPSRVPDIATRRRLSTPKSSPSSAKRSLSFSRSSKVSMANSATPDGQKPPSTKPEWFKSFDRLSRKKLLSSSKTNVGNGDTKTLPSPAKQTKSLRFFGDTDTEYAEQPSYRSARSNLSKTDKKYRSAHDLDAAPKMREAARNRSSSLHNLDEEDELNLRGHSSTLIRTRSPSPPPSTSYSRQERSMSRNRTHHRSRETSIDVVDTDRPRSQTPMRHGTGRSRTSEHKKPPVGPPKPARTFERRDSLNRDIDRILDSSGTEGESSQQSQRSVVFLHATTVGDIPHPQIANARRRAYSRESLNQSVASSKKVQPMTRTVSRSISVLAPWKPKNIREGYEIDYHKEQQTKPISTLPRPGTLSRSNRDRRQSARDDPDSDKSSAFEQSAGRSSVASEQRRSIGGASVATTPYSSTTLPSSRRVKDSIAHYPSRTGGRDGSTLKYR
ncbi:uncharacterized protein LOC131215211 [Anopheles bellator]|uniref:uncharacterized protein LOC131215211 n=1 Tax=Anopheles bellator TaxID=139047 RepID=UPI002649838C|nr:uncharacterized protein LOC131215211 [Anopheles bellator]